MDNLKKAVLKLDEEYGLDKCNKTLQAESSFLATLMLPLLAKPIYFKVMGSLSIGSFDPEDEEGMAEYFSDKQQIHYALYSIFKEILKTGDVSYLSSSDYFKTMSYLFLRANDSEKTKLYKGLVEDLFATISSKTKVIKQEVLPSILDAFERADEQGQPYQYVAGRCSDIFVLTVGLVMCHLKGNNADEQSIVEHVSEAIDVNMFCNGYSIMVLTKKTLGSNFDEYDNKLKALYDFYNSGDPSNSRLH